MPVNIANILPTNSWQFLVDRLNDVITVVKTSALTANSTTTGNCAITGTFQANTLSSNNIVVTSITAPTVTSNTTSMTLQANNTVSLSITANTVTSVSQSLNNVSFSSSFSYNTSGVTNQIIDSFAIANNKSCEYILDVKDNIANNHTHSRLSILNVNGTVYNTEYGIIISNNSIGQFTVSSNTTHVLLYFQPASSTNTSIKGIKTLLTS